MSEQRLKLVAELPDGERPVGITTFQGRALIACESGHLYELGETLSRIPIDFSGIQRALDELVQRGEAEYPGDGSIRIHGKLRTEP